MNRTPKVRQKNFWGIFMEKIKITYFLLPFNILYFLCK